MKTINVYIDNEIISVDGDKETAYKFSRYYIEKLNKEGYLPQEELVRFGFEIFNNIFSNNKRRDRINRVLNGLSGNENLAITISSEFEDIHNIPFEIINMDGTHRGFLLKRGNISIVRDIPSLDKDKEIKPVQLPIRILILLSLPLRVYQSAPFNILKELDIIYAALDSYIRKGLVEIDVEEKVNIPVVKERLLNKDYHIVHFSGHGIRGGRLVIEDDIDNTRERYIEANELRDMFRNRDIRLFYFDACETAQSTELEPSLSYHIFKGIPTAHVIANIAVVKDSNAIETTRNIYERLFKGIEIGAVLNINSLRQREDWWKPVLFARAEQRLFDIKEEDIKRKEKKRIEELPPDKEIKKVYVYRYGIVRDASYLIEKANHLVLHGIGGAGKSTMARYLSRFYNAKFTHILFFDLKDMDITEPENLLDEMLFLLERKGLINDTEYKEIFKKTKGMDKKRSVFKKWDFINGKLKDHTLLILDNLEDTMQDERGLIREEWKPLIGEILKASNIFTIFTTRLKPYLSERQPLENIQEIGEYTEPELNFLLRDIDIEKQSYLISHREEIVSRFGLHPLSISKAIEERFDNLEKLMKLSDFKGYFEFYRKYFEAYRKDTQKLLCLEYPFSVRFIESVLSPDFVSLIKDKLLILKKYADDSYLPYRVLVSYFKGDFEADDDVWRDFKNDVLKIYESNDFTGLDTFNILSVLLSYYEGTKDRTVEEKINDVFNRIDFQTNPEFSKAILERFSSHLKGFSLDEENMAVSYNNIALAYRAKGDYDKAIEFYDKALKIDEYKLGKDHPDTAATYNNIAGAYHAKGEYDKAIEFYYKALKIFKDKLGKDHPDTAATYNNIAGAYYAKGEYDKAIEFYDKAMKIYRRRKDYQKEFLVLPYLIHCSIKSAPTDFLKLSEYLCDFLELFDVFLAQNKRKAYNILFRFIKERTFEDIEMDKLRAHIKYPICGQRLEKFLDLIKSLSASLEKANEKESL